MAALVCDICGGKLVMQSGGVAKCDSCGMEYTKERIQEKVQEIKGTVKIDGPVETVKGDAEKERLLSNAKLFYDIGNYKKCVDLYTQISEQFPNDYRSWIGLAKSSIATRKGISMFDIELLVEKNVSNALNFAQESLIEKEYAEIYEDIIKNIKRGIQYIRLNAIKELLIYKYNFDNTVFKNFIDDYYKKCCNNAENLKIISSHATEIATPVPTLLVEAVLYGKLSDIIAISEFDILTIEPEAKYTSYGYCSYGEWGYRENIENIKSRIKERDKILTWKDNHLCTYCGGSFSFWTGKCKNCGKEPQKWV